MRSILRDRALAIALGILGFMAVAAVFGPLLWTKEARLSTTLLKRLPPSWAHPLGTDEAGRDVLARLLIGARYSLLAGVLAVIAGTLIGGTVGLLVGSRRGRLDTLAMRVLDVILAFPPLILAMGISTALGRGLTAATIGIVFTTIPYFTRLVRADVMKICALPHVESSIAMGASRTRTLLRHVVPHTASTMLIQSASVFGYTILSLAALGYIGLGADDKTPEWGLMITKAQPEVIQGRWWMGVYPGLALLAVCTAANVIADRVRARLHAPVEAEVAPAPVPVGAISPTGVNA